ncbi:hypothetical protein BC937DRAFT_90200 [Endogone sp. FLAS-F59071]|nr:hypothetical protein BC937DRAFT_90200 [Endogone sp. FLAS-F59071]|eukprot:RUS22158.1 hypothetical protein BC937DRAFT_90200 [Endogone sp. FLAS-F59071]
MPVFTIAHNVNNHILLERLPPIGGELHNERDGFHVVTVDVEYGGIDGFGNVSTVRGGPREPRISSKTDLVVDDNVDGTTGGVGRQGMKPDCLIHNALSGNGSVAVHNDGHRVITLVILGIELEGAGLAEDDGIYSFKMRRVCDEGEVHPLARGGRADVVHTQMVLDVAGTLDRGFHRAGELAEDRLVGLANHITENVQPATMGHTNDDGFDALIDGAVNLVIGEVMH